MELDYLTLVELLTVISEAFSFPSLLVFSIVGIVAAFFGYYIFMKALRVIVAVELGTIAYSAAVAFLPESLRAIAGLPVSVPAVIGVAFAIIGALSAHRIYKLFVFAAGALFGLGFAPGLIAGFAPSLIENQIISYIAMGIGAIIFGVFFTKAFRPLFILYTSLGGMMCVGATVGIMLCPDSFLYTFKEVMYQVLVGMGTPEFDVNRAFNVVGLNAIEAPASNMGLLIIGALAVVGLLVGFVAMVKQFKTDVE